MITIRLKPGEWVIPLGKEDGSGVLTIPDETMKMHSDTPEAKAEFIRQLLEACCVPLEEEEEDVD